MIKDTPVRNVLALFHVTKRFYDHCCCQNGLLNKATINFLYRCCTGFTFLHYIFLWEIYEYMDNLVSPFLLLMWQVPTQHDTVQSVLAESCYVETQCMGKKNGNIQFLVYSYFLEKMLRDCCYMGDGSIYYTDMNWEIYYDQWASHYYRTANITYYYTLVSEL